MKGNPATIRYQSTLEYSNVFPKHTRYVSNFTKNSSATFDKQQFLSYQEELKSLHNKRQSCLFESHPAQSKQLQSESINLLQQIQVIMEKSEWLSRHERIRINQWLVKLTSKQLNPVWKKNVNFYLEVMLAMMQNHKIGEPFVSLPNDGPLPKLTIYDIPYPIRQRFTQSKEKSQNRNQHGKGSKQTKSVLKQKRESLTKMETFNPHCEISILQKNGSWLQSNLDMNFSILHNAQNQISFQSSSFQVKLPTKPVFSNDKARKQAVNRSNPNSNKYQGVKNKVKANTGNRGAFQMDKMYQQDKENCPNAANIKRQLFKSKEKEQTFGITSKEDYCKQRYHKKKCINPTDIQPTHSQKLANKEKFNVLPKVYELLHQNQATLSSQPAYGQLLQELTQLGKQLQINMWTQDQSEELNESALSENSKAFIKASEEIRTKFKQTDNQTLQFMSYLKRLKQKDKKT